MNYVVTDEAGNIRRSGYTANKANIRVSTDERVFWHQFDGLIDDGILRVDLPGSYTLVRKDGVTANQVPGEGTALEPVLLKEGN